MSRADATWRSKATAVLALVLLAFTTGPHAQRGATTIDPARLAAEGVQALEERRYTDALKAFTDAAKLAPRNGSIAYGAGVSALMLGSDAEAEKQFERALELDPTLIDASLLLGQLQYRKGRINEAVDTYKAAQKRAPGDTRLTAKITEWEREALAESRFGEARGVHFRVLFEGPVDQALARRAVEILEAAYARVGERLAFYPSTYVEVVLYTAQQFRDITRSPSWAGGIYDGRIRVPVKGALERIDDLERVLAHEYVHALIAGVSSRNLPAWVNEGLAVLLEPDGIADAERVVAAARSRPRLVDLHDGFGGLPASQATLAYAESAVAARAMLDMRGPSAVLMLLRDVGAGTPFTTAFHQRIGLRYEEFQIVVSAR